MPEGNDHAGCRQEIVDLHAQDRAFRPHELATICFIKFNRKPAPATIKLVWAPALSHYEKDRKFYAFKAGEYPSRR